MIRAGIATLVIALAVIGCDRDLVPSPRARHDARDDADARRLADQLAALPGVSRASVVVHRGFRDPLAPTAPAEPGTASILLVDPTADPARLAGIARELAIAALDLPASSISVVVAPAVQPAATATVGPFSVSEGSRRPLQATLAIALLTIAALAGFIAYRERKRLTVAAE